MQENVNLQNTAEEEGLCPVQTEEGMSAPLSWLSRFFHRLTDGFWTAVVQDLAKKERRLSTDFLALLTFLSFSALVALSTVAKLFMETFPVPFALVGALGGFPLKIRSHEYSSFGFCAAVLAGVFVGACFLPHTLLLWVFLFALFLLRALVGGGKLTENVLWRALISAVFSALYTVFCTPPEEGVFVAAFFGALLCAALVFAFCGVYVHALARENKREEGTFSLYLLPSQVELWRAISYVCLGGVALFSLRDVSFLGFSPALLSASFLTLCVTMNKGGLYGILCGALFGFAAQSPAFALALVVGALVFSLSFLHSRALATCLSFLSSVLFLLCFSSLNSFVTCAADLLLSHVFFFLFFAFASSHVLPALQEGGEPVSSHAGKRLQEKLVRLSEAFSSLSEVFYMATDVRLTAEGELAARLVRQAEERVCARCSCSTDCWEQNYGLTRSALDALSRRLAESHAVTPADLEPYFKSRCKRAEALCAEVNRLYRIACEKDEATRSPASLLCGEYASVARLLREEAEGLRREESLSDEQSRLAAELLEELGIRFRTAVVSLGRDTTLTVTGIDLSCVAISTDELLSGLESRLGLSFDPPEFREPLWDCTMVLHRRRALKLSCARLTRPAPSQTVSGDSTGFFESDSGFFYSLICDGMGKGRDAAFTSRLSSIFIEKLLTFSGEAGVTLEMLNRFLLSQKEERFSTVDLLEVDFYTARANFIKAGAAASYVRRGTGLYRIESRTPPAGILGEVSAAQTSLHLQDGDFVVMYSDGVAPSEESDAWLAQELAFAKERDPRALAEYLMDAAVRHHKAVRDDMSVCVLKVHAA